jgi:DNA mismatch repair protein MutL
VLERPGQLALLNLPVAERWLKQAQLLPPPEGLRPQPLLIPVKLTLSKQEAAAAGHYQPVLQALGMELGVDHGRATLRAVPLPLRQQNLQKLIPDLLGYLASAPDLTAAQVATWLARHLGSDHDAWNTSQAIQLLTEVERLCPQLVKSPPAGLLQPVQLADAIASLTHD